MVRKRTTDKSTGQTKRSSKPEVGYKKPPKEHQFKPGQTGNPHGAPVRRINLWPLFCKFMAMTDAELAKLDRSNLTQAEQTALRLVEDAKSGKCSGSERLARHVFDREEGKALERLKQDAEVQVLSVPVSRTADEELALLEERRQFYLQQKKVPLGTAE